MAFCCLPCACAGAGAHLEKTGFRSEGVSIFALRRLSRAAKNIENRIKKQLQKQLENAPHNAPIKSLKISQNAPKMEPKWLPKSTPEACRRPRRPVGGRRRTQEAPKSSKPRPKRGQERPKSAPRAPGSDFHEFSWPRGGPGLQPPRVPLQAWRSHFARGGPVNQRFRSEGVPIFSFFAGPQKKGSP